MTTEGLDRGIARLAIPAFGALLAQPLFLLVDAAIVGPLGTAQLAGRGAAAPI
ncbi:MAG: MATE family efflux transporter, partial [Candidatus Nanopelagicales bacterium]